MPRWFWKRARSWRTWALLLCIVLLAAIAGRFLWAEIHLRAARRDLERREYAQARTHLNCYLTLWPRSPTAHLLAARCARGLGNFDEADRLLAACQDLGADPDLLSLEEELLDAQRGTLGRAGEDGLWDRVREGDPEAPRILEALALGYLYTQRLGEAMACLKRWLALAPGDGQALYLRGLAWEGMGQLDRAGKDYRRAVRQTPENVPARKRLAEYLIHAGHIDEAARRFRELLEQEPNDAALALGLARCRSKQARLAEARRLLDELVARPSPPVAALVERARLAQRQGDLRGAVKWYRQALDRDPFDFRACFGLAQCLRQRGHMREARKYEARSAQIEKDINRLRRLHEQMGKHPDDVDLAYQAGLICLRNRQKEEARRWFRNVLQRDPFHPGARRGLDRLASK
jgi:tetratricopeptide (TPR) repeat protein